MSEFDSVQKGHTFFSYVLEQRGLTFIIFSTNMIRMRFYERISWNVSFKNLFNEFSGLHKMIQRNPLTLKCQKLPQNEAYVFRNFSSIFL